MRWAIEVCRTCGRLAQWPFCEHRPEHFTDAYAKGEEPWCMTISVRPTAESAGRLKKAMLERSDG